MFARGRVDDTERLACIEADILALQSRKRAYQQAASEAADAQLAGQVLSRDARIQQELSELMVDIIEEQLEQQWEARDALVPRPRASDGA